MASIHALFKAPADTEAALWRYTDINKYEALLKSHALYFSRADKLGDPFEGSVSRASILARMTAFQKAPPQQRGQHTVEIHLGIYTSFFLRMPKLTFVSCWHMNEVESTAMWRLYAEQGIALRTTVSKLLRLTPDNAFVVEVRYANYSKEAIPDHTPIAPFVFKRKSFAHENEVRAIIQDDPKTQGDLDARSAGKLVDVSLIDLIDSVHVYPSASDAFRTKVVEITERYGLEKKVHRSEIDSPALF
jgi:hypothetical protein